METIDRLTHETTELLQAMIRNECVNLGTDESGHEVRNAELLVGELEGIGLDMQSFEPTPGRASLVARHHGTDLDAPALLLMGHTDVVPVDPSGWDQEPFGGELIDGEVWGRGAIDMLNITSSMAIAFREIVRSGKRYPGDIVYAAVADEENGGTHGAAYLANNEWDAVRCDYVLTELNAVTNADQSAIFVPTAEKGGAPFQIVVRGTPGHASAPMGADNALIKASEIVRRIADYVCEPQFDELWTERLKAFGIPDQIADALSDPIMLRDMLAALPPSMAGFLHACTHMSLSPTVLNSGDKGNVIPGIAKLNVDIRTLPGQTVEDAENVLREIIGEDLIDSVEIIPALRDIAALQPSSSPTDTPLWNAVTEAMQVTYPGARTMPYMIPGGTDARFFRHRGVTSYGAGLLSADISMTEFASRFHGHNERVDVESLRITTQLWLDICDRLWA